ncbi:hypothetical protein FACS189465_0520 [Clostridia bacterium]|nr:hypothetical protein FACS189465_0520 [Clostridia bacterium]
MPNILSLPAEIVQKAKAAATNWGVDVILDSLQASFAVNPPEYGFEEFPKKGFMGKAALEEIRGLIEKSHNNPYNKAIPLKSEENRYFIKFRKLALPTIDAATNNIEKIVNKTFAFKKFEKTLSSKNSKNLKKDLENIEKKLKDIQENIECLKQNYKSLNVFCDDFLKSCAGLCEDKYNNPNHILDKHISGCLTRVGGIRRIQNKTLGSINAFGEVFIQSTEGVNEYTEYGIDFEKLEVVPLATKLSKKYGLGDITKISSSELKTWLNDKVAENTAEIDKNTAKIDEFRKDLEYHYVIDWNAYNKADRNRVLDNLGKKEIKINNVNPPVKCSTIVTSSNMGPEKIKQYDYAWGGRFWRVSSPYYKIVKKGDVKPVVEKIEKGFWSKLLNCGKSAESVVISYVRECTAKGDWL